MKRLLPIVLLPLSLSAAPDLGVDVQDLVEIEPFDLPEFTTVEKTTPLVRGEVWKELLEVEIEEANQLEVQVEGAESIFVEAPAEISAFRDTLCFGDQSENGFCLCGGDMYFIFKRDGQVLAKLSLRGRDYLRWSSGAWRGDALLTDLALDGIGLWLHRHGYSRLHRERIAIPGQEKQRLANLERFKTFFTEDEQAFLFSDSRDEETGEIIEATDPGARLLAATPDQVDLLVRIFYALGTPLFYSESDLDSFTADVAIHAARGAEKHVILDALERVRDERWALYGAGLLFFEEGLAKRFTEREDTAWALRLAEPILLYSERAYKKDIVLEMVASLNNTEANDFLLRVARGQVGAEVGRSGYEAHIPRGIRPTAYLFLAQNGERSYSGEMRALMGASFNNVDKEVLQAALALSGDYHLISRELLQSKVELVAESTREAIIQSKDVTKVDLLVEGIEQDLEDGSNYIDISNLLAFQRVVGMTFHSNPDSRSYIKDPRPLQKAIKWWHENRRKIAQQWATESPEK